MVKKHKLYQFNQKTSSTDFINDVKILKETLETHHPSLYWYTTKDSLDKKFNDLIYKLGKVDSLSETICRNELQKVIATIKCGHTLVRFSTQYNKASAAKNYPSFPLQIKTWDDSLVVLGRYNIADSMLKRGTIITKINNKTPKQINEAIFKLISTDGDANNHKSQITSGNFPLWYTLAFGLDSVYTIEYINNDDNKVATNIKWHLLKIDTTKKKIEKPLESVKKPSKKQLKEANLLSKRSLVIDSATNTAYIRLSTFSGGKLPQFFRKTFKQIKNQHIEHLVFDIRENGGGKVRNAILLTKYVHQYAFKVGDTIAAKKPTFKNGKYINLHWAYTIAKVFGSKKKEDGLWHNQVYENAFYAPKTKYHYDNKIYIIQGGYSFSAATLFAGWLKNQSNVTILGEESGGAFYGNSAMFIPTIYLPNSKLRVSLPLYKLVMDKYRNKGNGILPDISIPPSSFAIKRGVDIKIEVVKKLIEQSNLKQQLPLQQ